MSKLYLRLRDALQAFSGRRFYPALVGAVALADYFIPGSPSNTLLVASVLPNVRRWRVLGAAFAIGCAGGATLLAILLAGFGQPLAEWVSNSEAGPLWQRIEALVSTYGLFALAGLAISPFPVRIAVAVLALAGFPPLLLGGMVLAGRVPVYLLIAWLAARAPDLLARTRLLPVALRRGRTEEQPCK